MNRPYNLDFTSPTVLVRCFKAFSLSCAWQFDSGSVCTWCFDMLEATSDWKQQVDVHPYWNRFSDRTWGFKSPEEQVNWPKNHLKILTAFFLLEGLDKGIVVFTWFIVFAYHKSHLFMSLLCFYVRGMQWNPVSFFPLYDYVLVDRHWLLNYTRSY